MAITLQEHFSEFRRNTIGANAEIDTPYGRRTLVYADWTATGRLYWPIEKLLCEEIGPLIGNTHSEASHSGRVSTEAYNHARQIIKAHVNAGPGDALITCGAGATAAVNKLQRLMGLKSHCLLSERPLVVITHMEHHSNHISWCEAQSDLIVVPPDHSGRVSLRNLEAVLRANKGRRLIGAFTACSNVTGVCTPYREMARLLHDHGGVCVVDFSANAPYVPIDMHPVDSERLDAVFFSPHKFLGGPGSCGVLVLDAALVAQRAPDHPGGGTVLWTNPWGEYRYHEDLEAREDGGSPAYLQTLRASLALRLKEKMGIQQMLAREAELVGILLDELTGKPGIRVLAEASRERLGIVSVIFDSIHYNLATRVLSDCFGVQVRGGCSCAGTYGHYLLGIDRNLSKSITDKIDAGDLSTKPGWVRVSLHPTMSNAEVDYIAWSLLETARYAYMWESEYRYLSSTNEWRHVLEVESGKDRTARWFDI